MNKKNITLALIMVAPILAFASSGDATFTPIVTQIKAYLSGSLGSVFVFLVFLGAVAAIAGFAPMKLMFPVFGLSLVVKFGPNIIDNVMGATGEAPKIYNFNNTSLDIILAVVACISALGIFYLRKKSKELL